MYVLAVFNAIFETLTRYYGKILKVTLFITWILALDVLEFVLKSTLGA